MSARSNERPAVGALVEELTSLSRRRPPEALVAGEVRALMAQCGRGPAGLRNMALIVVFWRTGMRCAEALALRRSDVDMAAGAIRIRHGKGDRSRTVGIDREAMEVLARWCEMRAKLAYPRMGPLFCTISRSGTGRQLDASYVRTTLRRLGHRAGVDRRVHPHAFRHTFTVEAIREGISIELIRRQLGHSSLQTTTIYAQGIAGADVVETIGRRAWPTDQPSLTGADVMEN
jgi:integrase/recombinase XerC